MYFEQDHIAIARRYDAAVWQYKYKAEAIHECPRVAERLQHQYIEELRTLLMELKKENDAYDAPGGKHQLDNFFDGEHLK